MPMNSFLSTAEAAKILGVSRITIFNRIKSGQIKAVKVGRNYIIAREEIEALTKQGELSSAKKAEIDCGVDRVFHDYGKTLQLLKDA